jgi:glutamyl-tRNA synthetase
MKPDQLLSELRDYVERPETLQFWRTLSEDPEASQLSAADPDVVHRSLSLLASALHEDPDYVLEAVKLEQERVTTLGDFGEAFAFFFQDLPPMDEKARAKWLTQEHVPELLNYLQQEILAFGSSEISVENCEKIIRGFAERKGFEKIGPVVHPTRVALTGKTFGPGLFELMSVLGSKRMLMRIEHAKTLL